MEQKSKMFYGWWIVAACFVLMFAGVGILINTYGVLFGGILADTGFSRGGLGLYFTIMSLSIMVASPILGKMMVKYNTQAVLTVCIIITGLAFMAFSQATQLWHFYVIAIIAGVFGAGTSTLPASLLITNWFNDKRGTAMGIAFAGSGIGGMLCNPLAQSIINTYGWQMAYIILGIALVVLMLPFALFVIKLHPSQKGLVPLGAEKEVEAGGAQPATVMGLTAGEVAKSPVFWLLALTIFLTMFFFLGIQNNIPIWMQDLGHSPAVAASIMAAYMGVLVVGKLVIGAILDKFGAKAGITFCMGLLVLALFFFINGGSMVMAGLFVLAFAMGGPVATVYPSFIAGHLFGNLDYGTIYGFVQIFVTLGMAFAMPITGAVYDSAGTLLPVWYAFMVLGVVILLLFYLILGRQPKLKEQWHS
ncbi:MAG: MFS transporter [Syntrophomonadaceae bacterium]|nr:MFS transporter [Syntrophomonadaceae bacterium]